MAAFETLDESVYQAAVRLLAAAQARQLDERGERAFVSLARTRYEFRKFNDRNRKTGHHMNEPAKRFCVYLSRRRCLR